MCVCVHRDGLEDPLDDAGLVQQQLDQLSTIGRCEYEKTCALLVQLFDQAAQTYQELLQSTNSSTIDITVQEGEYTHACTYVPEEKLCSFLRWSSTLVLRVYSVRCVQMPCSRTRRIHTRELSLGSCRAWGVPEDQG